MTISHGIAERLTNIEMRLDDMEAQIGRDRLLDGPIVNRGPCPTGMTDLT